MIRPTTRAIYTGGALFGLSTGIALFAPAFWWLWAVLATVWVIAMVADAIFADTPRDVVLTVQWPQQLAVGDRNSVVLTLQRRTRSALDQVHATLRADGVPFHSEGVTLRFSGKAPASGELHVTPTRRGLLQIAGIYAAWKGPLGLMERRALLRDGATSIPCVTSLANVHQAALAWSRTRQHLVGVKVQRMVGDGREFDALREYQQGHDHRAIDWRTSARMHKLHVREFRDEKNHQVVLAVDNGRHMLEEPDGTPRVDLALNASMLMGYVSLMAGDRAMLYAFDRQPTIVSPVVTRLPQMRLLVDSSARVPYSHEAANYPAAFAALDQRLKRRSIVVIYTNLDDEFIAASLHAGVRFLTKRHLVIVAAIQDRALAKLGETELTSMEDVQSAVLLNDLHREREASIQTLRQLGVRVVTGHADEITQALLYHYSEVKRRGLI